jgi:hypothetical protein
MRLPRWKLLSREHRLAWRPFGFQGLENVRFNFRQRVFSMLFGRSSSNIPSTKDHFSLQLAEESSLSTQSGNLSFKAPPWGNSGGALSSSVLPSRILSSASSLTAPGRLVAFLPGSPSPGALTFWASALGTIAGAAGEAAKLSSQLTPMHAPMMKRRTLVRIWRALESAHRYVGLTCQPRTKHDESADERACQRNPWQGADDSGQNRGGPFARCFNIRDHCSQSLWETASTRCGPCADATTSCAQRTCA